MYSHFISVVGWGVAHVDVKGSKGGGEDGEGPRKSKVPYWVVRNSWVSFGA